MPPRVRASFGEGDWFFLEPSPACVSKDCAVEELHALPYEEALFGAPDKAQLHPHCPLYLPHVLCRDPTNAADEPHFTHGGELICHRLALLALEDDQRLARVQAAYVTREWNDLHTIQILIGRVITQNDRWTLFANFPTHRRIESDPPDFTAEHR